MLVITAETRMRRVIYYIVGGPSPRLTMFAKRSYKVKLCRIFFSLPDLSKCVCPILLCLSISYIAHEPIHALLHTPSVDRTTRDNAPIPILELAQS